MTRPRLAVLTLLRESRGHRSADDIAMGLQTLGENVTRASVYNSLSALIAHGLVMMADAGPGRALYEATDNWHHHFVCSKCGAVQDVPCARGKKPCLDASGIDADVAEAQVIFRGLCRNCAA